MILAIDASNLNEGGGITHLVEMLRAADPESEGISKVMLWARKSTVSQLPLKPWLECFSPAALEGSKIARLIWQRRDLERDLIRSGCDLLFVPGGGYVGRFKPFVTMSRNMLPFEGREIARYGFSVKRARLEVLRRVQARTFRRASGVIFLTEYAKRAVLGVVGELPGRIAVIPHGVSIGRRSPRPKVRSIEDCSEQNPFRLIYVSHASPYKHQWYVIEAVSRLRSSTGWPLRLDMVGPLSVKHSVDRIRDAIARFDPLGEWARFHGPASRGEVAEFLSDADVGVFASTCENMPNVLLEKMAAGLPVVCSSRGPMPEVMGSAGAYFDPEDVASLTSALQRLIVSDSTRHKYSLMAIKRASDFTWDSCSRNTLAFLRLILSDQVAARVKH